MVVVVNTDLLDNLPKLLPENMARKLEGNPGRLLLLFVFISICLFMYSENIHIQISLIFPAIVDADGNQTILSRSPLGRNQHPARLRERTLN